MVFLKTCITKLAERNPLMSSIVRNSEAISLNMIATKKSQYIKNKGQKSYSESCKLKNIQI